MANSCKAIALLGGQTQEVCQQAWDYGRHLGLAFQVSVESFHLSQVNAFGSMFWIFQSCIFDKATAVSFPCFYTKFMSL